MRLVQRIKNLWKLSEIDLPSEKGKGIVEIVKEKFNKKAVIVSMENPIRNLDLS